MVLLLVGEGHSESATRRSPWAVRFPPGNGNPEAAEQKHEAGKEI